MAKKKTETLTEDVKEEEEKIVEPEVAEEPKVVAKKDESVRFICSQYPNLKVIVVQKITPSTARQLQIPPCAGKFVKFAGNMYATSDKEEIAAIRKSASFKDGTIIEG